MELKLPGAGDGANDEPRGANEEAFEPGITRGAPKPGCNPSRSDVGFNGGLYEACCWVYIVFCVGVADEPEVRLGGPPISPSTSASRSVVRGSHVYLNYWIDFEVNQ